MSRLARPLLALTLLTVAAGGVCFYLADRWLDTPLNATRPGAQPQRRRVEIPRGAGFQQVVEVLAAAGVVQRPLLFEAYGRWLGAGRQVKAGAFEIDLSVTPRQLLEILREGGLIPQVKITIPEGFNRWQIADLLSREGLVGREAFLARVAAEGLEGRLFPDTYWIRRDATLDGVIRRLTDRFDQVLQALLAGHPRGNALREGAGRTRLIVLASLVEKEGRTDADRRKIARVFENRLARGMRLETDPTCVYAEALYRQRPHPRFCRDPANRYSTYVIDGLPPTAIANPGRAALEAALYPADGEGDGRLLFFVARRDGSGEHEFSATYAEHTRAVDRRLGRQR